MWISRTPYASRCSLATSRHRRLCNVFGTTLETIAMAVGKIVDSPSGIVVKAHDDKTMFMEATLTPYAEVLDSFALRVFGEHEGEYLVEEEIVQNAGKQAEIRLELLKDAVPMLELPRDITKACKIARAKGVSVVETSQSD